jgi:hypothetical protein
VSKLSDVFKYISFYRSAGHQIGRKVGDMLEILTYGALYYDENLKKRLHIEPKLYGFSDAGHKVEFLITKEVNTNLLKGGSVTDLENYIGFIECKKVGVEQTVSTSFKTKFADYENKKTKKYDLKLDSIFNIGFSTHGMDRHKLSVSFERHDDKLFINITNEINNEIIFNEQITDHYRLIVAQCSNNSVDIIGNDRSLRDFNLPLNNCRILEISNFNLQENRISLVLNNCLSGPQTPEKAKQASFVALDVRKKRFGSFDKVDDASFKSILVLTEFAHWEKKSRNMISACIDINLVVPDRILIEAFEVFNQYFEKNGAMVSNLYDLITKDNFEKNQEIQDITMSVLKKYDGKIFQQLESNDTLKEELVSLNYLNNSLSITSEI